MNMDREYAEFATAKAVQLLAIDSPTGFTARAAEWVKNEFESLGFSAEMTNKGGVLVKKVDAVTNAPISDVEFLVTDSDGNFIGNANGKFVTDSAGSFTVKLFSDCTGNYA